MTQKAKERREAVADIFANHPHQQAVITLVDDPTYKIVGVRFLYLSPNGDFVQLRDFNEYDFWVKSEDVIILEKTESPY